MIDPKVNDSLRQTFDTCAIHVKRMEFAKSKVVAYLPLKRDNFYRLDDETIGFLDQYIYRTQSAQITTGNK